MRHNRTLRKLGRTQAHRNMMYRNLVTSLFKYERIQTTAPKAKEARAVAERLITFAKKGDLHSRRIAARKVNEPVVLQKLFAEIGPRYAERAGGYTRIMRIGPRQGDNAEMVILELVDGTARPKVKDTRKRARARKILAAEQKKEAIATFSEAADNAAAREQAKHEMDDAQPDADEDKKQD